MDKLEVEGAMNWYDHPPLTRSVSCESFIFNYFRHPVAAVKWFTVCAKINEVKNDCAEFMRWSCYFLRLTVPRKGSLFGAQLSQVFILTKFVGCVETKREKLRDF